MRLIRLVLLFLILATAIPAAETVHPLDRPVRLNLWGVGLNDAAREIHAQTGIEVRYFLADLPATANTDNVFIVTGRVPLGTVLEGLARRFGFRFRVTATGVVECSRSYDWVAAQPSLSFPRMPPLVDGGVEAMRRFLGELVKPMPVLPGEHTLAVENYPLPDNPNAYRATAVLPPVLADYLERAVRCLEASPGDAPALANPALFARAIQYSNDWGALLGRTVARPRGREPREILADTADQAGVAILLHAPPSVGGRDLPAAVDRYTLGKLTEVFADAWGLGKRAFHASGAVLFEPGDGEYATDFRSRQLFWDGLAVAGFEVRRGDNAVLPATLRREVFPGVWRDPVCALQYSPVTGRLAVVAPGNVVAAVAARLAGMGR